MSEKRFDDDDYSIISETHLLRKGMPTVEEVLRAQGRRLTDEELNYMLSINAIPSIITQDMTPVLHKITRGDEDFYVVMVDEPPCNNCRKVGDKKNKCDKHKSQKKKTTKDGGLACKPARLDANDITIAFSKTPAYVCSNLSSGTPVLVPIDRSGNDKAGRAADTNDFKTTKSIRGILVKGPSDCPQFIADDKVPKKDGLPCFNKYVSGYLALTDDQKSVFYPMNIESTDGVYPKFEILSSSMPAPDIYGKFASNQNQHTVKASSLEQDHFQLPMGNKIVNTPPSHYPNQNIQSVYQMPFQNDRQNVNLKHGAQGAVNNNTPKRDNMASVYVATPGQPGQSGQNNVSVFQGTPRPPPKKQTNDKSSEKKHTNINSMYMK